VAYSTLMDKTQGIAFELDYNEKSLQAVYNQAVPIRQELLEARTSQDSLRAELVAAKKEAQRSHAKLKALRDSPRDLQECFRRSVALTKTAGDKIFLVISNLYFFNLLRRVQVDFSATFHHVTVLDFAEAFPVRAVVAQCGEYLAEEPGLYYEAFFLCVHLFFLGFMGMSSFLIEILFYRVQLS